MARPNSDPRAGLSLPPADSVVDEMLRDSERKQNEASLSQEERRLLEPWLINLFREEPDAIDREMENLLHVVKQRLTQAAEAELMPRAATTNAADPPAADA